RLADLSPEEFARESLLLGSRAIATVLHDPLLPEELCDPEPLRRLVELTKAYQDTAQAIWGRLLGLDDGARREGRPAARPGAAQAPHLPACARPGGGRPHKRTGNAVRPGETAAPTAAITAWREA